MIRRPVLLAWSTLLVWCLAAPVPAQERGARPPQSDQTVPVTRGTRLSIHNEAGEVMVRAWEKDAVRVQGHHSSRTSVNVRTTPAGLVITSSGSGPSSSVDYEINVPAWMPIKVVGTFAYINVEGTQNEVAAETVRGDVLIKGGTGFISAKSVQGEVAIDGARGKINVSSVNEGIKITSSGGDVVAETTNGSISMTNMSAQSVDAGTVNGDIVYDGAAADGGQYSFVTHNGNITIGLPENASVTFTVRTYNGGFRSSLPTKGTGDPGRGRRVTYVLGSGSAQMELESFGGMIRLRPGGQTAPSRGKGR
jgi:DUF4097 and DUF4098 domain-containing protein YvlB